jgi:hypothetical protein
MTTIRSQGLFPKGNNSGPYGSREDEIEDYFKCDDCEGKDFMVVYNFSLRFHSVNFSDERIYDKRTNERYQCTGCKKTFTLEDIEEGLAEIKNVRRRKST